MSNERLYYIQAIDKWLTYVEAHEYGYTLSRPLLETYYTQDLQPVQIRVDSTSGELYDLRVQAPHSWVTDIDSLNLYRLVGEVTLYTADKSNTYTSYSSSITSSELDNIAYNGEIVSYEDLYNNFGITKHPCKIYIVQDGNILSWHDEEENLYWDVVKKQWHPLPPSSQEIPNIYLNGPEIFAQSYTFKQNDGTEPSGQLGGGTQRIYYNNANEAYLPIIRYPITVVNTNAYFEQGHLVARDLPMGGVIRKDI